MPGKQVTEKQPDNVIRSSDRGLVIVIILLVLIIGWLLIKPPVPAPPARPPEPGHKKNDDKNIMRNAEGIVAGYSNNPHLDINALKLKTTDAGIITIEFRPHTAMAVTKIAPVGTTVSVQYTLHPDDEVVGYQLMSITNKDDQKTIDLIRIPPPPDIPDHRALNFTVDDPVLITDRFGGIVALRKKDALFHFKPGLVDDISALIKSAHHFDLLAVRRRDDLGFINIYHDKVYIVISLTMDNKTFLVR